MARPIQNTPTIKGEDAKRFRKGLLESLTKKLTPEEKNQYSDITAVISKPEASKYIQEVDNQENNIFIAKRKFYDYYNSWIDNTFFLSSVKDIIEQDDFKAIVNMGTKAVPFILEELEREPSNLVWALNMIHKKKITDKPNVTISDACKLWIKALKS